MIFYSNIFTKDQFRIKLIDKVKRIFGFKIWEGIWTHAEFLRVLDFGKAASIDTFELFLQEESKPKSFRHIKKYLEKEMIVCC
jgi:hypothetical protein